jgi:hypothetical protein
MNLNFFILLLQPTNDIDQLFPLNEKNMNIRGFLVGVYRSHQNGRILTDILYLNYL